jgi:hypothetical protein
VRLEVRPEPSEEERAAIVLTVERLLDADSAGDEHAPEWWAAGLREGLDGEEEGS